MSSCGGLKQTFLDGRVHVGGEPLETIPISSGDPQGTMIGPLLFLLFVNDLPDAIEALALLFADDFKMANLRTPYLHSFLIATKIVPHHPH